MMTSISRQRGATLLTVLLLLLIMTLLGLASLRSGLLEERMSGNLRDRGVGFQTAEAALREAEAMIRTRPAYTAVGPFFVMPDPSTTPTPRWRGVVWQDAADLGGLSSAVRGQYIIEEMGPAPTWRGCERLVPADPSCMTGRFRVTARSQAAGRAQVILQSNYALTAP